MMYYSFMKKIIGLVGFIGNGKSTVGDHLVECGYTSVSFAASLKDCVAAIFSWDRELLEGATAQSRRWREIPDKYWSDKLGKDVTPRWALQYMGTEVMRNHFFNDIWVASLEKRISQLDKNIVVTDVRFPNEIKMIRENGGELWWVSRDNLPLWYQCALKTPELMPTSCPSIHPSEYLWVSHGPFIKLDNSKDIPYLHNQVDKLL